MRNMKKLMQAGLEHISNYDTLHLSEIDQVYQYAKNPPAMQDAIWASMAISFYAGYAVGIRAAERESRKSRSKSRL